MEGKHFHIIVFITIGLDFCVRTLLNAILNVWYVVALMSHLCLGSFQVLLGWFTSGWEFMSRWGGNRCYPLAGDYFTSCLWVHNLNVVKFSCFRCDSTHLIRSKFGIGKDSSALWTCAKLWPNLIDVFGDKPRLSFTGFWLVFLKEEQDWFCSHKSL